MPTIQVTDRDEVEHIIEATLGLSVMEIIKGGGLDELLALCGGCCSCATCHVYVDEAFFSRLLPMAGDEDELLDSSSHRRESSRLSCQIPFALDLDGLRLSIAPEE